MDATIIAGGVLIVGWGGFFRGVTWMRRETWARGPSWLFWTSTALLGCSTFCYAAAPLLNWGQIAMFAGTGAVSSVLLTVAWSLLRSTPRTTPAKAVDVERAAPAPVNGWAVPSFSDMMGGGNPWANSPTIASIEAMGGD